MGKESRNCGRKEGKGKLNGRKEEGRRKVNCKKWEKVSVGDGEDGVVKCIGNGKEERVIPFLSCNNVSSFFLVLQQIRSGFCLISFISGHRFIYIIPFILSPAS